MPALSTCRLFHLPAARIRATRAVATMLAVLLLATVSAVGSAASAAQSSIAQGQDSFFQTREFRRDNLAPFPKWTSALERYFEERGRTEGQCTDMRFNKCHWDAWKALLDSLRGQPPLRQVRAVNDFMNERPYITDPINWGVEDYWASPGQFLSRDGDCEDYAIAKYLSLRWLGWPAEALRVVVLQDLNLRIPHAVLLVSFGDRHLILDNQIPQVVDQSAIRHYKPIYSVNETAWWLHR